MHPPDHRTTRRRFLTSLTALGAAVATSAACKKLSASNPEPDGSAQLTARPGAPTLSISPGSHQLGFGSARDGMLYVPASYRQGEALPLVVLLHGATGAASNWFGSYSARADAHRFLMLAPDSREYTWDVVNGSWGADVAFINAALLWVFQRCAIAPGKIALAGFSDGASYSLSLGLANGDLFSHVVAYSPGFFRKAPAYGRPPIWISHGRQDPVLPIDQTSRRLVPLLRSYGYQVQLAEFDGGHEVPPAMSDAALNWLESAWGPA
jgi:predicted esterase